MTLPDPYRGHAQPTWDTRTLSLLTAALGGVGAAAPNAGHNHDTRYAPSAQACFLDVNNGDGVATITALTTNSWVTINVAGTVVANPGGGFDAGTDVYTVPVSGVYLCQALVRVSDGFGSSCNIGAGIHTSNVDGPWFQWNKYVTGGGSRFSLDYTRIAAFTAGDPLRLYCWQDSPGTLNVTRAGLQIWRIG